MMAASRVPLAGPWVDFTAVGGASVLAYAWLAHASAIPESAIYGVAAALLWVGNWPHFAASTYRLYSDRSHFRRYPFTAVGWPFVVACLTVGAFLSPGSFAPWLVKAFLWWSPYHFSGQTVGISLLYAKRAGVAVKPWERRALSAFVLLTFLYPQLRGETRADGGSYYAIEYPTFGLPSWIATLAGVALAASALWIAMLLITRFRRGERSLPLWCWLPPVAQFVWFVLGNDVERYYPLVPFFHGLQYLLVAGVMQVRLREGAVPSPRPAGFAARELGKWMARNVALSAVLFVALPGIVTWSTGHGAAFAAGILGVAVQLHHFLVDGVVWKLRDPAVSVPLTGGAVPSARAA